jgi:hypothetical protein
VLSGWGLDFATPQHGHNDGSWHEMEEVTPHDATSQDPERGWIRGRIFRCKSCDEQFRVVDRKDVETASEPLTGPAEG